MTATDRPEHELTQTDLTGEPSPTPIAQAAEFYSDQRKEFVRTATCGKHDRTSSRFMGVTSAGWSFHCIGDGGHVFMARPAKPSAEARRDPLASGYAGKKKRRL